MRGRKYHHGNLHDALIREAVRIVATDGVAGLTMREVARRVGVSHAAPYRHFANLNGLADAVAEHGVCTLLEALSQIDADDIADRLRALVAAYVEFAADNPSWFCLTFDRADVARLRAPFTAAVDAGRKAGLITAEGDVADSLWCATHGLAALGECDKESVTSALLAGFQ